MDPAMDGESKAAEMVNALVNQYRTRCLWFLRPDYYPCSMEERLRVLDYIERYGDLEAFQKAATVRRWLSHPSNAGSAVS